MCGVIAIKSHQPVFSELYRGLLQLQHRGQEAAGLMTADDAFHSHRGFGLVRDVFAGFDKQRLPGMTGIGHVRYPTRGLGTMDEVQPFWLGIPYGISLAHNGTLVNYDDLVQRLQHDYRQHINTQSDSEVLLHLLANYLSDAIKHKSSLFFEQLCQAVSEVLHLIKGGYAVVGNIIGKGMFAFRDPHGIRPLVMGERRHAQGCDMMIASEGTPFFDLGFTSIGDVLPGELVWVDPVGQIHRQVLVASQTHRPCVFEYVYFARPDAKLNDISVYRSRLRLGENLAKAWRDAYGECLPDVVIPVPFTANTAALSFANQLGVRYTEGLYKNPFIGRTFIMADQQQRAQSVRHKLTPQPTEIKGKRVLLLDDSIVRGTTSRAIVRMVREAGAAAVYFASTAPMIKHPCYYGIDVPDQQALIAHHHSSTQAIAEALQVDKLLYQNHEGLIEAVTRKGQHGVGRPCMACMDGDFFCGKSVER